MRLLDFDDAGFGWHLFEIATSLYFHIGQPYYATLRDATIAGYRTERQLTEEQLALLPMFLAARGFTYLGWVHTRQETETARELTPMLVQLVCTVARDYSQRSHRARCASQAWVPSPRAAIALPQSSFPASSEMRQRRIRQDGQHLVVR